MATTIKQPDGKLITFPGGKAELKWNTNFRQKWTHRYSDAQRFVDEEVLKRSEKYTPLLTGMLRNSGTLGTDVGSGLVQWIAPYARKQYYSRRAPGSQTGPLRGPYWFERMKAVHGKAIIAGARRIVGKGDK